MIAPAMNGGAALPLPYRDLARRRARIHRQLGPAELGRLMAAESVQGAGPVDVELRFDRDSMGRATVSVQVTGRLELDCAGCAETLPHELDLAFSCTIVDSDGALADLAIAEDVVVADGPEIGVAAIVEDEMLLSLPERLCRASPCEHLPPMHYPADDSDPGDGERKEADSPFGVLAELDLSRKRRPD